jgi:hypothetical protein
MVSRRDGAAARSTGNSRTKGNSKASSSATGDFTWKVGSVAQQRCPSDRFVGFEFGREVSRSLPCNSRAVPAVPARQDARARAIAERGGLPHCEAPPRKGADSDGTPYYEFSERGIPQTMGSRAASRQEGQANSGIGVRSKLTLCRQPLGAASIRARLAHAESGFSRYWRDSWGDPAD